MELGPGRLSVLLPHIEAAVMNGKGHPGERFHHIFRRFPIGWIFRMIVVTVHRQAIATDKVVAVAVIVSVLGTYIVMLDGFL